MAAVHWLPATGARTQPLCSCADSSRCLSHATRRPPLTPGSLPRTAAGHRPPSGAPWTVGGGWAVGHPAGGHRRHSGISPYRGRPGCGWPLSPGRPGRLGRSRTRTARTRRVPPSVMCAGAGRHVRRATYSRHGTRVGVAGSMGWAAASASTCVQVCGTTGTNSYPPPPVNSQRPPVRSWARAGSRRGRRAARRCSAPGRRADPAGACRPRAG
jgi:hypothetical protein